MNDRYSRRQAMIGLGMSGLAGLLLPTLAGCDSPTPLPTQNAAQLNMFFWGSATRDKLTRSAITLFHQSHSNVNIASQYSGNDTYYTKLDSQIASGHAPDLIQMDMRYVSGYVRRGVLLELTELIYNQTINLTDFDAEQIISSKVNNGIYGVSLGSNYQCMFYDQTRLQRAGFLDPSPDMTWETFADYLIELSQALGTGSYGSSDNSGNYDNFEIWIRQRGKELYTVEGLLGFDESDVGDWYNYWDNLRRAKGCPPMSVQATLDLTGTPTDSSVVKGIVVFSHIFSNQYIAYQAATPHTLTLAVYPKASTPGMYIKVSQMLSIATTTKYQVDAADFVSFLVNNPAAVKTLGFERGVPDSASALAYLAPEFTAGERTIVNFMSVVANSGVVRPKVILEPPTAGNVATALQTAAIAIGKGNTSVSDGAKSFYAAAQKIVKPA